jgi:AcrR family transcriptional regulator
MSARSRRSPLRMPTAAQPTAIPYGRRVVAENSFVREPKQERSRVSFDKALDAAVSLMVERRSDGFTLAEVAQRAGVSTGSIYGRVDSKEDLIRSAHAREMARIQAEQDLAFGDAAPSEETFPETVARVVRTVGELLRAQAPVLAPFMAIGAHDPVLAQGGKAAYLQMVEAYRSMLLARREEIRHPEPERAVDWSCVVVYSVLARWLGLGSEPEAAGEGDWEQILRDLSAMVTAFLADSATAPAA